MRIADNLLQLSVVLLNLSSEILDRLDQSSVGISGHDYLPNTGLVETTFSDTDIDVLTLAGSSQLNHYLVLRPRP